ncbi:hypothetical protein VNO77_40266 [Canavalia gladiata]|uniref:Secreted protein n=1 Tax=Canavalia gladiata TaxID=3824 RepID=A0AAN9JZY7_CANGL
MSAVCLCGSIIFVFGMSVGSTKTRAKAAGRFAPLVSWLSEVRYRALPIELNQHKAVIFKNQNPKVTEAQPIYIYFISPKNTIETDRTCSRWFPPLHLIMVASPIWNNLLNP